MATTMESSGQPGGDKSDSCVLEMARGLLFTRPLAPRSKRALEYQWTHRPLASYVRESIWKFFSERHYEVPFEIPWHRDLWMRLNLGNELSRALFVDGEFDPNELCLLQTILRPGAHFMDIGAHEGAYTLFAARCVEGNGHVWSCEPSLREREALTHNIGRNRLDNVTVLPYALAQAGGEGELKIASGGRSGHNTLGGVVWDGVSVVRSETVPLRSLDAVAAEIGLSRLDLVKMDAEGAEMRIIQGGSQVLRELRPALLFEAQDESLRLQGGSLDGLLTAIRGLDYTIYAFDPDTGLPTAEPGPGDLNLVAVPRRASA